MAVLNRPEGNGDDTHIVVHLDIVVDAILAVHGVAGDAALQVAVHGGIRTGSALIGDFSIVQLLRTQGRWRQQHQTQ